MILLCSIVIADIVAADDLHSSNFLAGKFDSFRKESFHTKLAHMYENTGKLSSLCAKTLGLLVFKSRLA
jgi:hypothetical protein